MLYLKSSVVVLKIKHDTKALCISLTKKQKRKTAKNMNWLYDIYEKKRKKITSYWIFCFVKEILSHYTVCHMEALLYHVMDCSVSKFSIPMLMQSFFIVSEVRT